MSKKLVIVESPAKAKTIGKMLGSGYVVKSSVGHIRDLPERTLGVDIEQGFVPKYVLSKGKTKVIAELKKAVKGCDEIYLAPDPDREGEAIAWHLRETLAEVADGKPFHRVMYNEITPRAVRAAFEKPGHLDMRRVDAQQARRVLDRIVGYMVSPLLWRRLKRGLSAGRVQSVALRLLSERERQIQAFRPEEYWVMGARVRRALAPLDPFTVKLAKVDGEKPVIGSETEARALLSDLEGCTLRVREVRVRETTRRPLPPFITSTLQQAASTVCGFSPSRTMSLAQKLYEGVALDAGGPVGLITYMRTDSVNVSRDAQAAAREHIITAYGKEYYPASPNVYRSRASAQEAHEAIRPTEVTRTPESLKGILDASSLKLYDLIWRRFVASQMAAAKIAQKTVEIEPVPPASTGVAPRRACLFTASASEVRFDGFLKVMALDIRRKKPEEEDPEEEVEEVQRLPPLAKGDGLVPLEWLSERKETKPPARYSEASLIRALEANGVGRPSTYASILETLSSRDYTTREKRQLMPTPLGLEVNDLLVGKLGSLFDVGFTARMEERLDEIEAGGIGWTAMLDDFYKRFEQWMEQAKEPPADAGKVETMLSLLERVTVWAPAVQRGNSKRVYSDERFVKSVREQIEKSARPVSEKQLTALAKIAVRYREQLPEVEAVLKSCGFGEIVETDNAAPSGEEVMRRFAVLKEVELSERQMKFVESLRHQAESGRKLSEKQMAALDRIVVQNAAQIRDFETVKASLGLTAEESEPSTDHESPVLLEMLGHVTEWQAPVQRGKMSFDDQAFFVSLSEQFNHKRSLSPRQRYAMRRMVFRYKAQIPGFERYAAKLGLKSKSDKTETSGTKEA
ncbi:MAG TPA: type I DNA topoisomerase [Kiritimatiellia bacterium]|jgi:DNA topoisomerase-1|nr:type I DNA topoisomerase [Kiritimatiellia bacterium]HOR97397.1 type I DNA topoisomerase [Kiritimatiellia bacterium]HPC48864.1 type I DNA topoisomerase [Kiritimatiellia bacterium]HPK37471.1 type I DNA topoisomerase [Kiritimatiellia bacterium]